LPHGGDLGLKVKITDAYRGKGKFQPNYWKGEEGLRGLAGILNEMRNRLRERKLLQQIARDPSREEKKCWRVQLPPVIGRKGEIKVKQTIFKAGEKGSAISIKCCPGRK